MKAGDSHFGLKGETVRASFANSCAAIRLFKPRHLSGSAPRGAVIQQLGPLPVNRVRSPALNSSRAARIRRPHTSTLVRPSGCMAAPKASRSMTSSIGTRRPAGRFVSHFRHSPSGARQSLSLTAFHAAINSISPLLFISARILRVSEEPAEAEGYTRFFGPSPYPQAFINLCQARIGTTFAAASPLTIASTCRAQACIAARFSSANECR